MLSQRVAQFAQGADAVQVSEVDLISRRVFNPNCNLVWFQSFVALLNQITILTIALTGAALLREHGTIEHLLVMPLTAFEIAMAKVVANGLVILLAFTASMAFIVETLLDVPVAGSRSLLFFGASLYLFSAAATGIFLGTVAVSPNGCSRSRCSYRHVTIWRFRRKLYSAAQALTSSGRTFWQ